jgi:hypothetical protein
MPWQGRWCAHVTLRQIVEVLLHRLCRLHAPPLLPSHVHGAPRTHIVGISKTQVNLSQAHALQLRVHLGGVSRMQRTAHMMAITAGELPSASEGDGNNSRYDTDLLGVHLRHGSVGTLSRGEPPPVGWWVALRLRPTPPAPSRPSVS